MVVEPLKGGLEVAEGVFGDDIAPGNVTELQERGERPDNLWIDEPLDRVQVYLHMGD